MNKTIGEVLSANQQLEREIMLLVNTYRHDFEFDPDIFINKVFLKENGVTFYDIKVSTTISI